jgi:23S rRNA (adenine2503-C2)-methyltransferase
MAALDLFGMTKLSLEARARELLPGGAGVARAIYADLYLHGRYEPEGYGLSKANARAWKENFHPGWPAISSSVEETGSEGLLTRKALLRFDDGAAVETVLIPMPGSGRATLCVSTQAGCRMGCAFCETAKGGFIRNLLPGEITAQAMAARFRLGWEFRNVVFQGMGEPLDNSENVIMAIRVMNDQNALALDAERMTVCTSGPPGGVEALASAGFKRLNLSVSLNAANDEIRSALMPVNRLLPLAALGEALRAYPRRRNFVFGINYCLLPGINDSREDARAAAAFCRSLGRAMLNLIPYNPGSDPIAPAPSEEDIARFASWLEEEGQPLRRRTTRGRSIMAACGQLAGTARNQLAGGAD